MDPADEWIPLIGMGRVHSDPIVLSETALLTLEDNRSSYSTQTLIDRRNQRGIVTDKDFIVGQLMPLLGVVNVEHLLFVAALNVRRWDRWYRMIQNVQGDDGVIDFESVQEMCWLLSHSWPGID